MAEVIQPRTGRQTGLPDGRVVVGEWERSPLVERSDARSACMHPSGSPVASKLVLGTQSYLRLEPC